MTIEEIFLVLAIIGSILAAMSILIATRSKGVGNLQLKLPEKIIRKESRKEVSKEEMKVDLPSLEIGYSITLKEVEKTKEDLRTLKVEREIVSYALTRLYEAEAEGFITENERVLLVNKYKGQMNRLNEQIKKKELVVNLHELEGTRADLVKMFHDNFDLMNKKIESIQIELGIGPKESVQAIVPSQPTPLSPIVKEERDERKEAPKTRGPPKTEAEKKIEAIQDEVQKVLERLGEIETEA